MNPEDFRQLLINPGTKLSLWGDDGGNWHKNDFVKGTLSSYIIVERKILRRKSEVEVDWDVGAIVSLLEPLQTKDYDHKEYLGYKLFLIQRDISWQAWDDSDLNVFVYGIKQGEELINGPLKFDEWLPKTTWLACCSTMFVDNTNSEFLQNIKRRIADEKQG